MMKRIGMNPARDRISDYRPNRVTACMITYVPMLSGYFTDRLRILSLSMESMFRNTGMPFDLMVFDNGSCQEVQEFLLEKEKEGVIRFLTLSSENVGKIGAMKIMLHAAPGEVIAYSDDDIYFYPHWLEKQLELLDHFPDVGMVSGVPIRLRFLEAQQGNLHYAEKHQDMGISRERIIPDEWERDFCESTGRDPEEYLEETRDMMDIVLDYKGKKAFSTANHFQFISPKPVVLAALTDEWSGRLMRQMSELDESVSDLGYLRLSTMDRLVRHMGNVLTEEDLCLLESPSFFQNEQKADKDTVFRRVVLYLVNRRFIRQFFQRIYNFSFWLLNDGRIRWANGAHSQRLVKVRVPDEEYKTGD